MSIYKVDTETMEEQLFHAWADGWCVANDVDWLRLPAADVEDLRDLFRNSITARRFKDWRYHYDLHSNGDS